MRDGLNMKIKRILTSSAIGFVSALIANIVVTYLWSLMFDETAKIDWETSFRFAVMFCFLMPVIQSRYNKREGK